MALHFPPASRYQTVNCYSFAPRKKARRIPSQSTLLTTESNMSSPAETALTFVFIKSVAIVGSAFAAVLFLAVVGARKR